MRIGVAAHLLAHPVAYRGGIGTYMRGLLSALPEVVRERGHELHLFWARGGPEIVRELGLRDSQIHHHVSDISLARFPSRKLWDQVLLPLWARRAGIDVFHSLEHVIPLAPPAPAHVVTIHDAIPIRLPETFGPLRGRYKALMTRVAARLATRIIAISQATRDDLIRLAGARPEKTRVVYYGLNPVIRRISEPEAQQEMRERYGLPERFLIYVGTIEPRKNVDRILRGYALARATLGVRVPLVLAGQRGWLYRQTLELPSKLGIGEHVVLRDYIPQADLPALYSQCEALVFPTLYEGFGLPLLEALACGAPVITSNVSAMPEVVGEAGVLVDPLNVEQIAGAIYRVTTDGPLRARLAEAGPRRAREFTWERAARETVAVYEEALAC